ncbi:MFS transporter [Streptomyces sp. NPDC057249]|uniref:MFS transporter n=1 Tax=Streptomyces sp. NPDC057249 TaxID=3346067 RepID=UPI00362EC745
MITSVEFRSAKRERFDLPSALLSLSAVLLVTYGIKVWARHGYEPLPALAVSAGVVLCVVFVRRQKHLPHPMIDLALLGRRTFGGPMVANLLAMSAMVGMAVFLTQYLQSVLGLSPFDAALWSLVPAGGVAVMAPAGAALARRMDRAYVMGAGFILSACGFLWLAQVQTDSALSFTLAGASVYAGGLVAAMTLANELALGAAPPERAGSAAAVRETLGGATAAAAQLPNGNRRSGTGGRARRVHARDEHRGRRRGRRHGRCRPLLVRMAEGRRRDEAPDGIIRRPAVRDTCLGSRF